METAEDIGGGGGARGGWWPGPYCQGEHSHQGKESRARSTDICYKNLWPGLKGRVMAGAGERRGRWSRLSALGPQG